MSQQQGVVKQAGFYSISTLAAQIITIIASVLSRRFLGPVQTGIWATFQILVDYSKYSTLGVMSAVTRDIPFRVGQGDVQGADEIKNLAATFVFLSSIVIAAALFTFAIATHGKFRPEVTWGLMLVSGLIVLQRLNNLLVSMLRCYKLFEIESRLMVVSAIVNAFLVGSLSYYFKIYGFVWAMILSFIFNIIFILSRRPFQFKWNLKLKPLRSLVQYGFPLMLLGLGTSLFRSLDEMMIVLFLGFESLGWYSVALMVTGFVSNYPISLQIVFLPNFQEKFGKANHPRDMQAYLSKACLATALTMAIFIGAVWVSAPILIHWILPKFIMGIEPMKILCFNIFFVSLGQYFFDGLINIKKNGHAFLIISLSVALAALMQYAAITYSGSIYAVAQVTTLGALFFFVISMGIAFYFFYSAKEAKSLIIELLAITAYLGLYFLLLRVHFTANSFFLYSAQIGSWFLFSIPLVLMLNKKFYILDILKNKLLRKEA